MLSISDYRYNDVSLFGLVLVEYSPSLCFFPGQVEEIDDIDPFAADAIANDTEADLSETQKKNFRKVWYCCSF